MFCLSRRYSILPALASLTALPDREPQCRPWVGHQATGAQNLTQTANAAHHIGGSHDDVKIHEAAGDLCDQLVIANDISASSLGSSSCGALSNSADADGLAGAVGQNDSAADLLVSVTAINAQTDVQLDGLVELGGSGLAYQLQTLLGIVQVPRSICFALSLYFLPLDISYTLLIRPRRRP